ncbi:MAG: phosphate ABC transporter permease PstA [Methanomicrobiaceae archaeon]|nr:phosphate ABC transporter permease PstA [Methanomicrobiaceae archaeon]
MVLAICATAALFAALMLVVIVGNIAIQALPSLSLYFLTTAESDTPRIGMAISNAIVGTFMISVCATILATPFAIGTAIYLQRYAPRNWLTQIIRFLIEVLSGTPSIVLGIFGLIFLVIFLRHYTGGFSLIAGSMALSMLILPVIERAAEDAIERVPHEWEDASYALGASKWATIRGITIPAGLSGIVTGAILGFGRAAEESAVVILTAGYSQFMPEWTVRASDKLAFGMKIYPVQDLVGTLPYSVYHAYENSNVIPMSNGFAAAFVLIMIVLIVNLSAKCILWRYGNG